MYAQHDIHVLAAALSQHAAIHSYANLTEIAVALTFVMCANLNKIFFVNKPS